MSLETLKTTINSLMLFVLMIQSLETLRLQNKSDLNETGKVRSSDMNGQIQILQISPSC